VDADTGLPNGFGLAKRLGTGSEDCFVVAVVHLGGLSEAREALGYLTGTELLRRAVENIGQVIPQGIVGRVEGDELVVILTLEGEPDADAETGPGVETGLAVETSAGVETGLGKGTAIAEVLAGQLISAIAGGRYLVGGIEIALRAHVGATIAPWDGRNVVELIRRASLSARQAHLQGRPYRIRGEDTGALTTTDLTLLSELTQAVERGELRLAYQPQVVPGTLEIAGVEALLRWDSQAEGPVNPGLFIPLAERTGLIVRLTDWVLTEALAAAGRWADAGHPLNLSVNLSAADLTRSNLAEWVLRELATHGVAPNRLTLEVTETAATVDLFQAIDGLRPVRQQGVRVSIDDFGTGYTSLSVLPQLPLDELKLDQRFVSHCVSSPADNAIVRSVCDLGHRLGLEVVAEGVEDDECAAHLAELGFDLLQGYAFAKPLSEVELLALLDSRRRSAPLSGQ
jgi:EAL domain-containing protein (putative c-di-GMP-specific phosphodiesterase class I)/GGDEF domain-containing protein